MDLEPSAGRQANRELNLVPFIDLMSCLVAFLLVTAVWSDVAQLEVLSKEGDSGARPARARLSVLLGKESIWVGVTTGERTRIAEHDFAALGAALAGYRAAGLFAARSDIEIAAEDGVTYQMVVSAMDAAIAHGFAEVGYVDPASLSVRFVD